MAKIVILLVLVIVLWKLSRTERPRWDEILSPEGIRDAVIKGNKVSAIRAYRMVHRASLVDAKNAIEALEAELKRDGFIQ